MWIADDTIVAISTPAGRGGIGIVRLSGAAAKEIAERLVRLQRPLEPGRVRFAEVMDAPSEAAPVVLDQAVVTWFKGPRSYTGEDVVEIAVHGAPVLLDALVRLCVAAGARLARPGEFTERAFLSGRIDLTQAEAVDDLIEATTLEQARTAARQMGGGLSRQVRPVKDALIGLIAGMEAGIDFAEDDLEVMGGEAILTGLGGIEAPLTEMEESFAYGRVLREGFRLAIVGRPNAGKSSLFNRLVRRDRAIVTAQPGTTRDPVAERLEFAGIPVEVVDTAGLRVAGFSGADLDEAEAMGVTKSREVMAEADVVLLVVAADEFQKNGGFDEEDVAVMLGFGGTHIPEARCGAPGTTSSERGKGLVVVMNKVDLVRGDGGGTGDPEEQRRVEFALGTDPTSQKPVVEHLGSAGVLGLKDAGGMGDAQPTGVLRLRAARSAQDDGFDQRVKESALAVAGAARDSAQDAGFDQRVKETALAVAGDARDSAQDDGFDQRVKESALAVAGAARDSAQDDGFDQRVKESALAVAGAARDSAQDDGFDQRVKESALAVAGDARDSAQDDGFDQRVKESAPAVAGAVRGSAQDDGFDQRVKETALAVAGAARDSAQDAGFSGSSEGGGYVVVETSAVDGTGTEELRAAVLRELKAIAPGSDTAPVTNMRQHEAIAAAVRAVRAAAVGVERAMPHEMVLIDLHEALDALDGLTGTTHTEEILGVIFSRFCVGK